MIDAFQRDSGHFFDDHVRFDPRVKIRAEQHAPERRLGLVALRAVDDVADAGAVASYEAGADVAAHDGAAIETNAHDQWRFARAARVVLDEGLLHGPGGASRAQGVRLIELGFVDEYGHDRIADEFVDVAAELLDLYAQGVERLVQDR